MRVVTRMTHTMPVDMHFSKRAAPFALSLTGLPTGGRLNVAAPQTEQWGWRHSTCWKCLHAKGGLDTGCKWWLRLLRLGCHECGLQVPVAAGYGDAGAEWLLETTM